MVGIENKYFWNDKTKAKQVSIYYANVTRMFAWTGHVTILYNITFI